MGVVGGRPGFPDQQTDLVSAPMEGEDNILKSEKAMFKDVQKLSCLQHATTCSIMVRVFSPRGASLKYSKTEMS